MSAMTAPIGLRRTSAAIRSGVGRWARRASATSTWRVEGTAVRLARGRRGFGLRVQPRRDALEPFFECPGTEQALGDAGDDQLDVVGAEVAGARGEVDFSGALLDDGGEFLAEFDELADEVEGAREAARFVSCGRAIVRRWVGGRDAHEHNENIKRRAEARNIFSPPGGADTSSRSFKSKDTLPVILHADDRPTLGLRLIHQ